MTRGRFDPTVLGCLVNAGYDRTFSEVPADGPPVAPAPPAPGCGEIRLWPLIPGVALPAGVQLDLGGIGKGYAADIVAIELLEAGAGGVCVNVGGDLRVAGEPPSGGAWVVAVDDPFQPGRDLLHLALHSGAVATTTRLKRRWRRGGRDVHHVIDPASGEPASSGVAAVSVVAGEAWRAEALAKAAFLAGPADGARFLAENGVTGLVVDDHGRRWTSPGLEAYAA